MTTGCLGQSDHITNLNKDAEQKAILECIPYYAVHINDIHELKLQGNAHREIITYYNMNIYIYIYSIYRYIIVI